MSGFLGQTRKWKNWVSQSLYYDSGALVHQLPGGKKPEIVIFVNFCDVNTPTVADVKLPTV